jgi:hypothetical protein
MKTYETATAKHQDFLNRLYVLCKQFDAIFRIEDLEDRTPDVALVFFDSWHDSVIESYTADEWIACITD